jgi:hypothetical protein
MTHFNRCKLLSIPFYSFKKGAFMYTTLNHYQIKKYTITLIIVTL